MIDKPLPANRILVMRYRFIGDTILTVPFLRNLRKAYPNAVIDVLVGPQSGDVLKGCPYINKLITFDTTRFHKYDRSDKSPRGFLSYALELRKAHYDLVFVLKRSLSSALLAWLTGAKYRVGYNTQGRGFLLTHPVKWNDKIHEVESTLEVLQAAGVPLIDTHLESWISKEEKNQISKLVPQLNEHHTCVLIHAAAAHPDKMFPIEHWAQVIRLLNQKVKILPFFTGAQQDISLYQQLEALSEISCVNLAGKLTLRQSMALYQQMNLALCVDSGPAHLAAATGTPTIALFGPTDPVRWRPWGDNNVALYDSSLACRPCNYHKTCDDRPCLTKMPAEIIVDQAISLLSKASATSK